MASLTSLCRITRPADPDKVPDGDGDRHGIARRWTRDRYRRRRLTWRAASVWRQGARARRPRLRVRRRMRWRRRPRWGSTRTKTLRLRGAGVHGRALEAALTPVQRYMMRFLEETSLSEYRGGGGGSWLFSRSRGSSRTSSGARRRRRPLADEDDEVLYYEVPQKGAAAAPLAQPLSSAARGKSRGRKRRSSPEAARVARRDRWRLPERWACFGDRVAILAVSGRARRLRHRSSQTFELELWGPPTPPGVDDDELYVGGGAHDRYRRRPRRSRRLLRGHGLFARVLGPRHRGRARRAARAFGHLRAQAAGARLDDLDGRQARASERASKAAGGGGCGGRRRPPCASRRASRARRYASARTTAEDDDDLDDEGSGAMKKAAHHPLRRAKGPDAPLLQR